MAAAADVACHEMQRRGAQTALFLTNTPTTHKYAYQNIFQTVCLYGAGIHPGASIAVVMQTKDGALSLATFLGIIQSLIGHFIKVFIAVAP